MTVPFNDVPANVRVPFLFAEFDNSNAQQGPVQQQYRVMMIGPKIAAGSATADKAILMSSSALESDALFGKGSLLAHMAKAFRETNTFNELYCLPVDDAGGSVDATGSFEVTAVATKAGVLSIYIAGKKAAVAVAVGQTEASIITSLIAEVQGDADFLVSAAVNGGNADQMDFTAKNSGITGNDIDIRLNFSSSDETPEGVTTVIVAMAGGVGQPDLSNAISEMDDKQYILFVNAFADSANIAEMEQELASRFGPIRQNDGYAFVYNRDTLANQVTFGNTLNSQFTMVHDTLGAEHGASQISRIAGEVARAGEIDPARPFQNIAITGALAISEDDSRQLEDRNTLLFNGIFTSKSQGSAVIIERVITTYKTNTAGASDVSYLDLNSLLTLSFLRYDWRNYMLGKYPRHKLADDGTRFSVGQPIMTPGLGKAEAIKKFREWELDGLVEGADQFKADLIVERNSSDVNRLDFLLPTDLMNQLRVMATNFQFLL